MLEIKPAGIHLGLRSAAIASMFLVAIAGTPQPASSGGQCEEEVVDCTHDVDECVAEVNEPCMAHGDPDCMGEFKCQPGSLNDCGEEGDYAVVCVPGDDPT